MPKIEQSKFGFTENAERINSRYAMMGFFALLAVEGVRNYSEYSLIYIYYSKVDRKNGLTVSL